MELSDAEGTRQARLNHTHKLSGFGIVHSNSAFALISAALCSPQRPSTEENSICEPSSVRRYCRATRRDPRRSLLRSTIPDFPASRYECSRVACAPTTPGLEGTDE